ncbi:MAG: LacI family transcriptional regulator [Treponema sp.]|jgi:DNA-binding LacI/PurR family transcriptional regulator|nr:LacI family transcriptional regulator [Treponema sp.]
MKHITISDIAREAGVSKATVSRVLSKPQLVNEETRKKIISIIDKYSFSPNPLAQGLAGMPTKTIGVMIDELANDFYIELTGGIDSVISGENYSVQLMSSRWLPGRELRGIRSMIMNRVDGILMAPAEAESEATELLKKSGVPYVLINCTSGDPDVSYICGDNYKGGQIAAEYVNGLNREQIIIVDVSGHQTIVDRIAGFSAVIDKGKTDVKLYSKTKTYEDGYRLVSQIVERDAIDVKKTALFAGNDYVAMGVISRLFEMNISIPRQVSVIGYDDIRIASLCKVPLTTVSQSIYTMGQTAAAALIKKIRDPHAPPFRHIIEPALIIRESTAPL